MFWLHIFPLPLSDCFDFAGYGKDTGLDSSCVEHAIANSSTDSGTKTIPNILVECINLHATPRASYIKLSLSPIYISNSAKILSLIHSTTSSRSIDQRTQK